MCRFSLTVIRFLRVSLALDCGKRERHSVKWKGGPFYIIYPANHNCLTNAKAQVIDTKRHYIWVVYRICVSLRNYSYLDIFILIKTRCTHQNIVINRCTLYLSVTYKLYNDINNKHQCDYLFHSFILDGVAIYCCTCWGAVE